VEKQLRLLGPGEIAHIPTNVVHGTYNTGDETLVFLAILSPAIFEGPMLVDVSGEEPWASLRT
jgi:quercetin dioxygenase-like cupin family protein